MVALSDEGVIIIEDEDFLTERIEAFLESAYWLNLPDSNQENEDF